MSENGWRLAHNGWTDGDVLFAPDDKLYDLAAPDDQRALVARIAALEAENAALRRDAEFWNADFKAQYDAAEARIAALEEALREADGLIECDYAIPCEEYEAKFGADKARPCPACEWKRRRTSAEGKDPDG